MAVKIVFYSSPSPRPPPTTPVHFPLSSPQQRYNQKKISFGGQDLEGGGDVGKNSQITIGIPQNRLFHLVIVFALVLRLSFSLLTLLFFTSIPFIFLIIHFSVVVTFFILLLLSTHVLFLSFFLLILILLVFH